MAGSYISLSIGGVKYIVDTSVETVKFLVSGSAWSGGTHEAQSFLDANTNADYQVPVGKTLTIIGIIFFGNGVSGTTTLYQADTADATTTSKLTIATSTLTYPYEFPVDIDIAAQKYVTADPSAANVAKHILLVCVEV